MIKHQKISVYSDENKKNATHVKAGSFKGSYNNHKKFLSNCGRQRAILDVLFSCQSLSRAICSQYKSLFSTRSDVYLLVGLRNVHKHRLRVPNFKFRRSMQSEQFNKVFQDIQKCWESILCKHWFIFIFKHWRSHR